MASLNKVLLIGNLGKDPEMRYLPSGEAVANFSVATTDKFKDKNGDMQEVTEWHRISFFGRVAEVCGQYLKKGSPVYIGLHSHAQMAGQGRPGSLHHRDSR
jgi:single-strand DNA-binding protein